MKELLICGALAAVSVTNAHMSRIAAALVGNWHNVETMLPSPLYPHGAGRSGTSHAALYVGGRVLFTRGMSNGTQASSTT